MTKHRKQIYQLLQASHEFLENPKDQGKWAVFQKALESVEALEKAEALFAQPETFKNPNAETDQLVRRYYEEKLRPRNRFLLWSSIAIILLFAVGLFGMSRGIFSPLMLAAPTATFTATFTNTNTPTASSTRLASSAALTTIAPTASPTLIASNTPTSTNTLAPTASMTHSATPIPFFATGQIVESLTSDSLSKQYRFRGQVGDIVTLQLASQDFDPYVAILDEKGKQIAADDDCGSLDKACVNSVVLSSDGTYVIVVDSFTRRDTGIYTLDINVVHAPTSDKTSGDVPACSLDLPRLIIVTKESSVNLRRGPGQTYDLAGYAYNGECFAIMGRNATNTWLQIRTTSGRTEWIAANLTEIQGELDEVPVI